MRRRARAGNDGPMAIRIVELILGIVLLLGATIYLLQQMQRRQAEQEPAQAREATAPRKRRRKRLA